MDTFNFPVTDILLLDQNDNPIQIFTSTVKEKDVAIEFDRKEIKINRSYTLEEKKLLTKQMITGTFDIFMELNLLKLLNYENVETKLLENYSVVFTNSKTKTSLTLKNCNISMKGKINFKINKLSNISFKAEAQGEDNKFYEIKQGGDVLVIDFNYFLKEIAGIKKDINALSKGDLIDPAVLSAATTTFKKDEVYEDRNNLYWIVKADFTNAAGYPGGLPDSNFREHSVKGNSKQIESCLDNCTKIRLAVSKGNTSNKYDKSTAVDWDNVNIVSTKFVTKNTSPYSISTGWYINTDDNSLRFSIKSNDNLPLGVDVIYFDVYYQNKQI